MSLEIGYPPLDFPFKDPDMYPYLLYGQSPETKQDFYFLGVDHFNSPKDQQYQILMGVWRRFVVHNSFPEPRPTVTVHEGGEREIIPEETAIEALQRDCEQAMLVNLADRDGVDVTCNEPQPFTDQALILTERFGSDLASYFLYMRHAAQYIRAIEEGIDPGTFDSYVRSRLAMQRALKLSLYDFSLSSLAKTHAQLYPDIPMDPLESLVGGHIRSSQEYMEMFWPTGVVNKLEEASIIQRIGLFLNLIRDQALMRGLQHLWFTGNSIFDVHGLPHVLALEPIIGELLEVNVERYIGAAACALFLQRSQHVDDLYGRGVVGRRKYPSQVYFTTGSVAPLVVYGSKFKNKMLTF